jgi:hypothetical protein
MIEVGIQTIPNWAIIITTIALHNLTPILLGQILQPQHPFHGFLQLVRRFGQFFDLRIPFLIREQ